MNVVPTPQVEVYKSRCVGTHAGELFLERSAVQVDVAEEASTDDTTNEQCIYEVLDNNKTTDRKLSMELLEIPQQLVTRGFLELAEEARNIGVEKKQSFLVEEVLPQVTEMTRPMIEPV